MRIVIPGGTGAVGKALSRHFAAKGDEVTILSRSGHVRWDGKILGDCGRVIDGADVVVNLAGRSVNCRYTEANLAQMMDSRVDSTRVIGEAIAACERAPTVWLQMSTATIYAHRFDAPNDEYTGIIGGHEPGVPLHWAKSIDIAKAWEAELDAATTPGTRKVAMRSSMVMSPDAGSVFDTLATLAKRGLGGSIGGGQQYMSWIHELDFCRAIDFLIRTPSLDGAINVCSPNPLPQGEFMRQLREAMGVKFGLPASKWMVELGYKVMHTESELVLKSRRVTPTRLLRAGFDFRFFEWGAAAKDLASKWPWK